MANIEGEQQPDQQFRENKTPIIVGDREFNVGDTIKMIRSNGEIDSGWRILQIIDEKITVGKELNDRILSKTLRREQFVSQQQAIMEEE